MISAPILTSLFSPPQFQSHQIFHILVIAAAFVHYHGISEMAMYRLTHGDCSAEDLAAMETQELLWGRLAGVAGPGGGGECGWGRAASWLAHWGGRGVHEGGEKDRKPHFLKFYLSHFLFFLFFFFTVIIVVARVNVECEDYFFGIDCVSSCSWLYLCPVYNI